MESQEQIQELYNHSVQESSCRQVLYLEELIAITDSSSLPDCVKEQFRRSAENDIKRLIPCVIEELREEQF